MIETDFYDKVKQAREENQKVMCFIVPELQSRYYLYFVHDILDTNISLDDYDYKEFKGVKYVVLELNDNKFTQTKVGIDSQSLNWLIDAATITDFDLTTKMIIERFKMYMCYFLQASSASSIDLHVFLYLYTESVNIQRQIAKQLGVSINFLYNQTSINEIRPTEKRTTLLKCGTLRYNYIAMVYINVYTFDIYLQLYTHPNIDVLLVDITSPVIGNLLINIIPGDSTDQVISQYINFRSDISKILVRH